MLACGQSTGVEDDRQPTEEEAHQQAEQAGIEAAKNDADLPKRTHKQKEDEAHEFTHAMLSDASPEAMFPPLMENDHNKMLSFLSAQMPAKAGLKHFGEAGVQAIMKELEWPLHRKVMRGRKASSLAREDEKAALKCLVLPKEKRCG